MKYKNLFNLDGKVAIVAGGAGLIGKEIVKGVSSFGAITVIAEVDRQRGRYFANRLEGQNRNVVYRYLDITNEKSISSLIHSVNKKYGHIDVWVNSAYPRTRDWGRRFEDITVRSWKENINMHLNGCFISCQKIAEFMKKQKSGSIINFGSIYGIIGPEFSLYKGTKIEFPAPYSAIKGGIINFTRYLASYYGKHGVRVNCVSPGGIHNKGLGLFAKRYSGRAPLKRMADKEDIVGGVVYLASDAAKYVTGHNLVIDGGWTIV